MYIHVYSICALRAHCAHALTGPLKYSLLRACVSLDTNPVGYFGEVICKQRLQADIEMLAKK